jgi:hypothetical protein
MGHVISALLTTDGVVHICASVPIGALAEILNGHGRPFHGRIETCAEIRETDSGFLLTYSNRAGLPITFAQATKRFTSSVGVLCDGDAVKDGWHINISAEPASLLLSREELRWLSDGDNLGEVRGFLNNVEKPDGFSSGVDIVDAVRTLRKAGA